MRGTGATARPPGCVAKNEGVPDLALDRPPLR